MSNSLNDSTENVTLKLSEGIPLQLGESNFWLELDNKSEYKSISIYIDTNTGYELISKVENTPENVNRVLSYNNLNEEEPVFTGIIN